MLITPVWFETFNENLPSKSDEVPLSVLNSKMFAPGKGPFDSPSYITPVTVPCAYKPVNADKRITINKNVIFFIIMNKLIVWRKRTNLCAILVYLSVKTFT